PAVAPPTQKGSHVSEYYVVRESGAVCPSGIPCALQRHVVCSRAGYGPISLFLICSFLLPMYPTRLVGGGKACCKTLMSRHDRSEKDRTRPSRKDRTPRSRSKRSSRPIFGAAKRSGTSRRCPSAGSTESACCPVSRWRSTCCCGGRHGS